LCLFFHRALNAAYADNWGSAAKHLSDALELMTKIDPPLLCMITDWARASAALLHLGFGEKLWLFLSEQDKDRRLRPLCEAIRATLRGDRLYLRNIPAEMQDVAEKLHDEINLRLKSLPEGTRRWSQNQVNK
jgi:hypothetical protein